MLLLAGSWDEGLVVPYFHSGQVEDRQMKAVSPPIRHLINDVPAHKTPTIESLVTIVDTILKSEENQT